MVSNGSYPVSSSLATVQHQSWVVFDSFGAKLDQEFATQCGEFGVDRGPEQYWFRTLWSSCLSESGAKGCRSSWGSREKLQDGELSSFLSSESLQSLSATISLPRTSLGSIDTRAVGSTSVDATSTILPHLARSFNLTLSDAFEAIQTVGNKLAQIRRIYNRCKSQFAI